MADLHPASDEQRAIIENLAVVNGIVIDAVAGSGKTTTVLHIASHFTNHDVIQVTYNRSLMDEVRAKAMRHELSNLHVSTYHALALKYYGREVEGFDPNINAIFIRNSQLKENHTRPVILIIDEAQDMTPCYWRFIYKFARDIEAVRFLVFGDKYQGVYEFKGADSRYLSCGSYLWGGIYNMIEHRLSESHRLTSPVARFINGIMLGHDDNPRIIAKNHKWRDVVDYYHINIFDLSSARRIFNDLRDIIQSSEQNDSGDDILSWKDVFILAASVKSENAPIRNLANLLSENGINIYMPRTSDDTTPPNEKEIRNKVIFSTFCAAKGRERKIVVIYGFDDGYYKCYNSEGPIHTDCPSNFYVAATRTSRKLILIHHNKNDHLPFLHSVERLDDYVNFIQCEEKPRPVIVLTTRSAQEASKHNTTPTRLISHMKERVYIQLSELVLANGLFTTEVEPQLIPNQATILPMGRGTHEYIGDLRAMAIAAFYQKTYGKKPDIAKCLKNQLSNTQPYLRLKQSIDVPFEAIDDYMRLALLNYSVVNRLRYRIDQITNFNWLTEVEFTQGRDELYKHVNPNEGGEFECAIQATVIKESVLFPNFGEIKLEGRLDLLTDHVIWELKYTNELTLEHQIQLIIYYFMWTHYHKAHRRPQARIFKLFNIRTGEIQRLNQNWEVVIQIMRIIFENKYKNEELLADDEEFVRLNRAEVQSLP